MHEADPPPGNGGDAQSEALQRIVKQATAPMAEEGVPRPRLIAQFAFFPLAIVVIGVIIYLFLALLTGGRPDSERLSEYGENRGYQQPVASCIRALQGAR